MKIVKSHENSTKKIIFLNSTSNYSKDDKKNNVKSDGDLNYSKVSSYKKSTLSFLDSSYLSKINNLQKSDDKSWFDVTKITLEAFNFLSEVNHDSTITYQKFYNKLWNILNELHILTKDLNQQSLKKEQLFFRGSLFNLLNQSLVLSRALTKPYGYPGDFVMLQTLYDNKPISNTKLGCYLDQFFLDDELARAVVNRVEVMGNRVIQFINNSEKDELNILNIASGSGFELKKIVNANFNKKVIYHCFDQEVASLSYIAQHSQDKNPNVEVRLYKEDIRTFFRNWKSEQKFDFIYNIGLADYLPNIIMSSLVKESLENLNPQGIFVLAHKDYTLFPYHHPSWLYDWNFIHRDLEQYKDLLRTTTDKPFSVWFESDKKIVYFSEFNKSVTTNDRKNN